MPKSFFRNELVRPVLASLIAFSVAVPMVTRADEATPRFLEMLDFQTFNAMSSDAKEEYIRQMREMVVDLADKDAGTDFEFFGGNDKNVNVTASGWRGGYYAILSAFTSPAEAQNKVVEQRRYDNDRAQIEQALRENAVPVLTGRASVKPERMAELKAAKVEERTKLLEKLAALNENAQKQGLVRPGDKGAPVTAVASAPATSGSGATGKAESLVPAGAAELCPKEFRNLNMQCFIRMDDSFLGAHKTEARKEECNKLGGVLISNTGENTVNAPCASKEFLKAAQAKGLGYKALGEKQQQIVDKKDEKLKANLCDLSEVKCAPMGGTKKEREDARRAALAERKNKCINAGNVSKYRSAGTSRVGKCEAPPSLPFGPVTVACDESQKNVVLCNPILFDTAEPYKEGATKIKGRCVPKSQRVTAACNELMKKDDALVGPRKEKRFWENQIPGMQEGFKELQGEVNSTCSNPRIRLVQCSECSMIQARLKKTASLEKCYTGSPLPPSRPAGISGPTAQ